MAGDRGPAPNLANLWPAIQAAAGRREGAAGVWAEIRARLGVPEGPTGVARDRFNQLWSQAVGMRNAADQLDRLLAREARYGRGETIGARQIAEAPWSRSIEDRNAAPAYQVNFLMTLEDEEGNQHQQWATSYFRGTLPPTAGDLANAVQGDAEQLADKYEQSLVSVDSYQILAV